MSNIVLTHKETNILKLELKCAPKKAINKFEVYRDIHKYIRKIDLKKKKFKCRTQDCEF